MIITNAHMLDKRVSKHFVVVQPPITHDNQITVQINLNERAAILEIYKNEFPAQHTVEDIRSGKIDGAWLLSGGTLIKNQDDLVAIGIRDGNAADPFAFSNIGAGRCDQKLKDHCCEEMATEFILCILKNNIWHQADLGKDTRKIENLQIPSIRKKIASIIDPPAPLKFQFGGIDIRHQEFQDNTTRNIIVKWGNQVTENLNGYVWIDAQNHTVEFRLALKFDLSSYDKVEIFYGEGFGGYANWKSGKQSVSDIY